MKCPLCAKSSRFAIKICQPMVDRQVDYISYVLQDAPPIATMPTRLASLYNEQQLPLLSKAQVHFI